MLWPAPLSKPSTLIFQLFSSLFTLHCNHPSQCPTARFSQTTLRINPKYQILRASKRPKNALTSLHTNQLPTNSPPRKIRSKKPQTKNPPQSVDRSVGKSYLCRYFWRVVHTPHHKQDGQQISMAFKSDRAPRSPLRRNPTMDNKSSGNPQQNCGSTILHLLQR